MWEGMMQDKIFQDKPRDVEMKELKQAANLNTTQSACFSKIHSFHFRHQGIRKTRWHISKLLACGSGSPRGYENWQSTTPCQDLQEERTLMNGT